MWSSCNSKTAVKTIRCVTKISAIFASQNSVEPHSPHCRSVRRAATSNKVPPTEYLRPTITIHRFMTPYYYYIHIYRRLQCIRICSIKVHLVVGWRHTGWDEGSPAAEFPLALNNNMPASIVLLFIRPVCVYRTYTSASSFVVIHSL